MQHSTRKYHLYQISWLFPLTLFITDQIKGAAIYRINLVYKADNPYQYWIMQIGYLLFAGWFQYTVYFC